MKLFNQLGIATFSVSLLTGPAYAATDADGYSAGTGNTIGTGQGNVAVGSGNTASGKSLAVGTGNTASTISLAVGDGNTVAEGSFAVGYANHPKNASLAVGADNDSDAFSGYGALMGYNNSMVESLSSFILGEGNTIQRQYDSLIAGQYNNMIFPSGKEGYSNFILGFQNEINATGISGTNIQQSILLGAVNTTSASTSWVFGGGNIGQYQTVTLGMWNQTVSDAALIVGNGTNPSNRSNGFVVLKNGNASVQGSLTIAGSSAVTTSYLSSANYLTKEWGSGADAAGNAIVALGDGAEADAEASVAIGVNSTAAGVGSIALSGGEATAPASFAATYGLASGATSFATQAAEAFGDMSIALGGCDLGYEVANLAAGDYSTALGGTRNQAVGDNSLASGYWTKSNSAYSVSLGSMNSAAAGDADEWIETDSLFELGNGWAARSGSEPSSGDRSNAITTLKNGETTLTNKAWKANVAGTGDPLEDPSATTTDSGGRALVVEGHTELKGKVIIAEPQGDISMGIFQ